MKSPFIRPTRSILFAIAVCLVVCVSVSAEEPKKPADEAKPSVAEGPVAEQFRDLRNLYRENPAKAVQGFRGFLERFGESEWADDAQYWLAMSLEKSRAKHRDIIAAYQTLIDKHPKSPYRDDALFAIAEAWLRRARRAEERKQAIKAYLKFIESCPKSKSLSEAKLKVGELHYYLREYDKAAEFFCRVLKEHPKSPFADRAHRQLADTYLKMGRPDDALAIYKKLLVPDLPDKQRIALQLGMVNCYLKQPDGLEKALKTCQEMREESNQRKSLEDFTEYKTREKMASYYLGKKKYKEAEAEYEAYITRFGKSVGVWQAKLNIGTIRLAADEPAEAREMFQAVTSGHAGEPDKAPWYVLRAMYLEAYTFEVEKNLPEARRLYEKLIQAHPKSHYSRQAHAKLKKLDELQKEAEKPPEPAPKPTENKKK